MDQGALLGSALNGLLARVGLRLVRRSSWDEMTKSMPHSRLDRIDMTLLASLDAGGLQDFLRCVQNSSSQLHQDLFALVSSDFKRNGWFVEFGATNGVELSNTLLLERQFGWTGILAEPARHWHNDLRKNRRCIIDTDCVWETSGKALAFLEADSRELSTLRGFQGVDAHAASRRKAATSYDVTTVSLKDLLERHGAPPRIDFLSVDTEGSEFNILKGFDFDAYRFSAVCVEHNYTAARESIHELLSAHGYRRVFQEVSCWDDWYVDTRLSNHGN